MPCEIYFGKPPKEATRLRTFSFDLDLRVKTPYLTDLENELEITLNARYNDLSCQTSYKGKIPVHQNRSYDSGYIPKYKVLSTERVLNDNGGKTYKRRVKGIVQFPIYGRVNEPIPEAHLGEALKPVQPYVPWWRFWKTKKELAAEHTEQIREEVRRQHRQNTQP